jgi:D-tyrosyl-tRNA(Tyr) deacylase
MRVILQRVQSASVKVDNAVVGEIRQGLLLLVGFGQGDSESCIAGMVEKVTKMRIFPNEQGRFDRSVLDVGGEILAVSQFTLYADTSRGRRPEFFQALNPQEAEPLFKNFLEVLRSSGVAKVASGVFGAHMLVESINDGPVTITLERS